MIRVYKSLSDAELRKFKKWVYSPFANRHTDVQKMIEFLMSRASISPATTNKERAYNFIFPDETIDLKKLRYVMAYTLDVLEEFIAYMAFSRNKSDFNNILAKEYRERKLSSFANESLENFKETLKNYPLKDSNALRKHFDYELENLYQIGDENRHGFFNFKEVVSTLNVYYIAETLKHACSILMHETMSDKKYEIPLIDSILEEVEKNDYEQYPAVLVYFYIYKSLLSPSENYYFDKLMPLLDNNEQFFTHSEWKDVYLFTINYSIKRVNSIDGDYQTLFSLYKKSLEKGYLLNMNEIDKFAYRNITRVGLILGEYDWVKTFLEEYKDKLDPKYKEQVYLINLAQYYFSIKAFDKTMPLLLTVEYSDVLHVIGAKLMLMKIYYETNEFDALDSFIKSFGTFLKRKKKLGYHKKVYLNILNMTKLLLKLDDYDIIEKERVRAKIEMTKPVGEKNWLMEQLNKKNKR